MTSAASERDDLVGHLMTSTGMPRTVAARVVDEVVAFFAETTETYVRRRHRELQAEGLTNDAIFQRVAAELATRPVSAPTLSSRQLRRIVYG